ncbi:MAG: antibiotic biosynthesis monooxygenase [Candidatus Micrarchaeaceae archaeon]
MINIGLYYKVKEGREKDFEKMFQRIREGLTRQEGFNSAKLYKSVEEQNEYMIYSEWKDLDSFAKFVRSEAFKQATAEGREIIEGTPKHRVFQELFQ